jgi:hypothetical protein
MILRALSVRQPWAFAITHLGKTYENRPRRSHYRGPLLIHAGKTLVRADYDAACDEIERLSGRRPPPEPELGGIVGAAMLVGCAEPIPHDAGWRQAGAFGLELGQATVLPFRAYQGALGLFKVELMRREVGLLRAAGVIEPGRGKRR